MFRVLEFGYISQFSSIFRFKVLIWKFHLCIRGEFCDFNPWLQILLTFIEFWLTLSGLAFDPLKHYFQTRRYKVVWWVVIFIFQPSTLLFWSWCNLPPETLSSLEAEYSLHIVSPCHGVAFEERSAHRCQKFHWASAPRRAHSSAENCWADHFCANLRKGAEIKFAYFPQKYILPHCYTFVIIKIKMSIRLSYSCVENNEMKEVFK